MNTTWKHENTAPAQNASAEIPVYVINTQHAAHAVQKARRLTEGLGARIVLLCPQVVPFAADLERPPVPVAVTARNAMSAGADEIRVILCRTAQQALESNLRPESLVVLGTRRRWWKTREEAVAQRLRKAGHQVILDFVNERTV